MLFIGPQLKTSLQITILLVLSLAASMVQAEATATLNLDKADIRVLVNTVSKATGKNFIIDPRVKAKVTVISSKPMEKEELYDIFLSILQVHGFAAVPSDNAIKIVPEVNAKQGPVRTVTTGKRPGGDELVTQVVQIANVAAIQLVPILRPLVPQQGHLAAYAPTNVLIVTDRSANISRLINIIRRIDRPDNAEIEVIALEHASASELVRIITTLQKSNGAQGGAAPVPSRTILAADERTNSILLAGDKPDRLRVRGIIAQLDTPLESGGNTKVIFLKYADAKNMVAILQGISSKAVDPASKESGQQKKADVDIQADETNNAIIITAASSIIKNLEAIIRQLDVRRAQVLIEAIIAEVSTDLAAELGAQFIVNSDDESTPIGGTVFSAAGSILNFATDSPSVGDGLTLGAGDSSGSSQFAFILKALKGDAATNILSTPTIVTLDNVEAEIVFGQNVPFVTGSFSNTGGTDGATNPFQTIERQDVGLTLKVKPQINEGNGIRLEIEQETSSIAASSVNASDIVTNKRSLKTEVMVDDGQTIVLGGLIEDTFIDTKQKVPVLGSIPLLGRLFSFNSTQKVKQNLMIFIRPVIINDAATADHFTRGKYNLLRTRQLDAKIRKRGLMRDSAAELPDIEVLFTPLPEHMKPADATPVINTEKETTSDSIESDNSDAGNSAVEEPDTSE